MEPYDLDAHTLHEALEQLGWRADAKTLSDRVRRMSWGLPAEDEFCVLLSWLGRARLVHKLDQMQVPPQSREVYQVPDLLAVFSLDGRDLPALVEVKARQKNQVSCTEGYVQRLEAY